MISDPKRVDGRAETERFKKMAFDSFRELARDSSLTEHEKMGAAPGHREGYEDVIWSSMTALLPRLQQPGARVLDIGPGCGEIARRMIALCEAQGHALTLVDHQEMLDMLPASAAVTQVAGRFPEDAPPAGEGGYDVIVAYSVLHYVIIDANPFAFMDAALQRLNPGGRLLIGDIPNASKLRRFLASEAGAAFHRAYMRTDESPNVPAFAIAEDRVDDGVALGMMMRARMAGFDAYLLPQPDDLPFANRREDLLVLRP